MIVECPHCTNDVIPIITGEDRYPGCEEFECPLCGCEWYVEL